MMRRLSRLLHEPDYRSRVWRFSMVLMQRPKSLYYKGAAFSRNKLNRLERRIANRNAVRCNVCGWSGNRFDTIGTIGYIRHNAYCPSCGSLERHRAMLAFLGDNGLLSQDTRCLDVGGIPSFRTFFERIGMRYVSISLGDPAMVCMNVQQLGFPDNRFDLILDAHVLEYVKNYRQALKELWRVLRNGGTLLLTEAYRFGTPHTMEFGGPKAEATFMVRRFGDDLIGFLREAGFHVALFDYTGRNDSSGDYFFICQK